MSAQTAHISSMNYLKRIFGSNGSFTPGTISANDFILFTVTSGNKATLTDSKLADRQIAFMAMAGGVYDHQNLTTKASTAANAVSFSPELSEGDIGFILLYTP